MRSELRFYYVEEKMKILYINALYLIKKRAVRENRLSNSNAAHPILLNQLIKLLPHFCVYLCFYQNKETICSRDHSNTVPQTIRRAQYKYYSSLEILPKKHDV